MVFHFFFFFAHWIFFTLRVNEHWQTGRFAFHITYIVPNLNNRIKAIWIFNKLAQIDRPRTNWNVRFRSSRMADVFAQTLCFHFPACLKIFRLAGDKIAIGQKAIARVCHNIRIIALRSVCVRQHIIKKKKQHLPLKIDKPSNTFTVLARVIHLFPFL